MEIRPGGEMVHSSRRSTHGLILFAAMAALLNGCAATTTSLYLAAGSEPLCRPEADPLGRVAVLPEAAWRADQKDVGERLEMAQHAIESAFTDFPCGDLTEPGGISGFARWADRPEAAVLEQLGGRGIDTVIFLRLEELTPRLLVTLSLPFLWSGTSEADFRIRAIATETSSVLIDLRVKRSTGGPFHLRPASWAEAELEAALRAAIARPPPQ